MLHVKNLTLLLPEQHQRSEDQRTQFDFNVIPVSNLPEQISWLLVEKTEVANACDSEALIQPIDL